MDQCPERCSLCGDTYHKVPDTEGWMGLICPGADATEEQGQLFLDQLVTAYANYIAGEFDVLNKIIAERRRLWYERTRNEVSVDALVADCVQRTEDELDRQRRDEVFTPYGGIDIDIDHLVVRGKTPPPGSINTNITEDYVLYLDDDPFGKA